MFSDKVIQTICYHLIGGLVCGDGVYIELDSFGLAKLLHCAADDLVELDGQFLKSFADIVVLCGKDSYELFRIFLTLSSIVMIKTPFFV